MSFNKNFYWGASTSAFQIEGGKQLDGKGLSTVDTRKVKSGIADTSITSDFYHHWREDISLMKELGINSFRMSISWSRILPEGNGNINLTGLKFYDQVIDCLLENNIEPIVTINHFDMPVALIKQYNGWISRKSIGDFANYAQILFKHFGDRVKTWLTINEPLMLMYNPGYNGSHYNNPDDTTQTNFIILHHILLAEKYAFKLCHQIVKFSKIAPVSAFQNVYPLSTNYEDISASMTAESILSYWALDVAIKGHYPIETFEMLKKLNLAPIVSHADENIFCMDYPDFIAFNYYSSIHAGKHQPQNNFIPPFYKFPLFSVNMGEERKTDKWSAMESDANGLIMSARKLYNRYHLELMVTENGYADTQTPDESGQIDDQERINYLRDHINACKQIVDLDISLLGYFVWSFIDSLSGREGFSKRYGLVYVNRTDQDLYDLKRIPKKSFYWYKNFIKTQNV
ncbi:glycoside hydrolase family 1 protein [Bombilactobacillus bombi]|uniref:Glycoside hydrolase family 1 protein n=1 Tax=Bombilactobacillus bombi TaxID=1303590 RepID=A0A3R6ZUE7_9LACO|nr:glycoside hydrolase family 1 protein [Bombilactobacillus bombi]RHW44858.1 glycoside hydrolase family 1 protein [Bombilactobacillus bombi]